MKHISLLSLGILFAACSSSSATSEYYREHALLNPGEPIGTYSIEKKELEVHPYRQLSDKLAEAAPPVASGDDAKHAITIGNQRFVTGGALHPRQGDEARKALIDDQHPHTAVLSCSDSRVPPEIVFDQGVGDIFAVRTAGEVADPAAVASLEYAVEHLGVKMILVMGHSSCGAVKTALTVPRGKSAGSKDLDHLVASLRSHLSGVSLETAGPNLETAVRAQVEGATKDLLSRSKIIREASEKHGLAIAKGLYHLDTGKVDIWN